VKSTPVRIGLSALAGLVTFYVIGATGLTLGAGGSWLFDQYRYAFGLAPLVGHALEGPWILEDEFYGRHGSLIAGLTTIAFWTILFGGVYFRYVFRARQAI
jgi:hypothetical protein